MARNISGEVQRRVQQNINTTSRKSSIRSEGRNKTALNYANQAFQQAVLNTVINSPYATTTQDYLDLLRETFGSFIEVRTDDPATPAVGRIWYRSDLG